MKRDPKTDIPNVYSFAREYLHRYLLTVRGCSPKTIEAYRISLECFVSYLVESENVERAKVSFDYFDRTHLKAWLAWMVDNRHYAPKTIALRFSAIKAFLAYSSYEDITLMTLSQTARTLRSPASSKTPIEYLSESETRAILAAFDGRTAKARRNRMLLILLYDTAARVSEITGLHLQDLSLAEPGHVTLTGKGNKARVVPLTNKTIEHLRVYLAEFHPNLDGQPATLPVFYSLHQGRPMGLSVDTVSAVLKDAARIGRIDCPSIPLNIHCHMLRKTKAMDLYQQGIPLPIIMRLLGHENSSVTAAFYAFATLDMMREAINAATPAISSPTTEKLTEDKLQALYDLR